MPVPCTARTKRRPQSGRGRTLEVTPVDDSAGRSVGRWEGMAWDVIKSSSPTFTRDSSPIRSRTPHPGGESYGYVHRRCVPAINAISKNMRGKRGRCRPNMLNRVYRRACRHRPEDARELRQANCCMEPAAPPCGNRTRELEFGAASERDLDAVMFDEADGPRPSDRRECNLAASVRSSKVQFNANRSDDPRKRSGPRVL